MLKKSYELFDMIAAFEKVAIGLGFVAFCSSPWANAAENYSFLAKKSCNLIQRVSFNDATEIATAKLYIEHNHTDEDTGVHGAFDDHGWSKLCVYDPSGKPVLDVSPKRKLKNLSMAGIFFESREPPNDEYSIADLRKDFPEGEYEVRGITFDGNKVRGAALFTHDIPSAPEIVHPLGESVVPLYDLEVSWQPVTHSITGEPLTITGYEIIITKEVEDDPNGFSRPTFDVHVTPNQNSIEIPEEFLEPGTEYELEILALEQSGNQTISVSFFSTQ